MKEFWNVVQAIFAAVGGWLGYFLGGCDGLLYALLAFVVLLIVMRRLHRYGGVFAGYLILYCLGRGLIEPLRQDQLQAGGIPVTMIVCAVGLIAGILLLLHIRKQPRVDVYNPFRPAPRRR